MPDAPCSHPSLAPSSGLAPTAPAHVPGFAAAPDAASALPFGVAEIDRALAGGLPRGSVHEVYAEAHGDAASATGFALATARRLAGDGAILWIRQGLFDGETGVPHGAGLAELGLDPARVVLVRVRDALAALQTGLDAARCGALTAAVVEIWGEAKALDLTASRRLALAARTSGATLLMTRAAAPPAPSAAETRWQVRAAPSRPGAAHAPGGPAFHLKLLRQRSGMSGLDWFLEWDRDRTCFVRIDDRPALATAGPRAPLSGAVVPLPAGGQAAQGGSAGRRAG